MKRTTYTWNKKIEKLARRVGKDIREQESHYRDKRPNILGICNCSTCIRGRVGRKDGGIMKLKRKLHNWKSNKPAQKGAYTD